jgi:hypothetical protein
MVAFPLYKLNVNANKLYYLGQIRLLCKITESNVAALRRADHPSKESYQLSITGVLSKGGIPFQGRILWFRGGGGNWDPTDWQTRTVGIFIFLQTTILHIVHNLQDITLYWMSHIKLKMKINISLFYLWNYSTIKIIQVNVYVLI